MDAIGIWEPAFDDDGGGRATGADLPKTGQRTIVWPTTPHFEHLAGARRLTGAMTVVALTPGSSSWEKSRRVLASGTGFCVCRLGITFGSWMKGICPYGPLVSRTL